MNFLASSLALVWVSRPSGVELTLKSDGPITTAKFWADIRFSLQSATSFEEFINVFKGNHTPVLDFSKNISIQYLNPFLEELEKKM